MGEKLMNLQLTNKLLLEIQGWSITLMEEVDQTEDSSVLMESLIQENNEMMATLTTMMVEAHLVQKKLDTLEQEEVHHHQALVLILVQMAKL